MKEGETVNVGSLLGTINSSATTDNNIKEVNNYTPPKKENTIEEIKIFEEEKILKPKKQKKIKNNEIKLENETPLILDQVH